ncbi:MAG: rhodanese-like domain-containing protein [Nitrolancea sp.]
MIFRSIFNRPQVAQINPDDAHQRLAAGAVIVDVREPDEWRSGHIPGAVHIPLGQLGSHVARFDKSQELIMVCRSGNRSAAAVGALAQAGYEQVSNLQGGMIAWNFRRLPVTR